MKLRLLPYILAAFVFSSAGCSLPKITLFSDEGRALEEYTLEGKTREKILVMSIDGIISDKGRLAMLRSQPSMVQQTAAYLKRAEQDPNIKALLIKVNTPGGTVTASDIIYHEIKAYKERTGVKIIVAMMSMATSGGYYISLPADLIMAHPTTVTGSIGVIFTRPNLSGLMEKVGVSMGVNTSGVHKDMGSPYRPGTDEEFALFQDLTDDLAQRFIRLVMQHRNLDEGQRQQVATARVFLADEAVRLGLVDRIGYLDDAIARAREMTGMETDGRVIAYRRYEPKNDTVYNPAIQTPAIGPESISPVLSHVAAVSEAGFYYIWPAALGQ